MMAVPPQWAMADNATYALCCKFAARSGWHGPSQLLREAHHCSSRITARRQDHGAVMILDNDSLCLSLFTSAQRVPEENMAAV
eukprot:6177304-Pleurochrysis_carterae.AAC.1